MFSPIDDNCFNDKISALYAEYQHIQYLKSLYKRIKWVYIGDVSEFGDSIKIIDGFKFHFKYKKCFGFEFKVFVLVGYTDNELEDIYTVERIKNIPFEHALGFLIENGWDVDLTLRNTFYFNEI